MLMLGQDHKITQNVKNVQDSAKENVENIHLNKWKRQQRKLKPFNRDALYKDYEELEKSKNTQVNPNYNHFNKMDSKKTFRRDLSKDNFNTFKSKDHRIGEVDDGTGEQEQD